MTSIVRGIYQINVYKELCKACGLCVAWCPQDVLAADAEGYPITPYLAQCINCKLCERHCPDFAIEVIPPEVEVADVQSILHAR
jgi:2-oxoglutarate ferredoxin oxidoreductase subunit delta